MPTSQFGALIDPNFIVGVDVRAAMPPACWGETPGGQRQIPHYRRDDVVFSDNPFGAHQILGGTTASAAAARSPWAPKPPLLPMAVAWGDGGHQRQLHHLQPQKRRRFRQRGVQRR
ncbi:hypothetical protein M8494_03155 [Serratia ureilytica]